MAYSPRRNIGLKVSGGSPYAEPGPEAPYDPLSSIRARGAAPAATPVYEPGGGEMPLVGNPQLGAMAPDPNPIYEPGGGEIAPAPYDPLSSISTGRPYGAAGYAMPDWVPPTPPVRPSGLGTVLSKAVQPSAPPMPPPRPTNLGSGPPAASPFIGIDRQNSGPNDRFRGGGTALDLSGLLGGLFGRR